MRARAGDADARTLGAQIAAYCVEIDAEATRAEAEGDPDNADLLRRVALEARVEARALGTSLLSRWGGCRV